MQEWIVGKIDDKNDDVEIIEYFNQRIERFANRRILFIVNKNQLKTP